MVRFNQSERHVAPPVGRVWAARWSTIMRKFLFAGLLVAFVFTCAGLSYAKQVGC